MEISVMRKQGMSLRKIAREIGCSVNTVRRHLKSGSKPQYVRSVARVTKLAPFHDYLRDRQLAPQPEWIPATVLLREIQLQGYTGGHTRLRAFMRGGLGRNYPKILWCVLKRHLVNRCRLTGLSFARANIRYMRFVPRWACAVSSSKISEHGVKSFNKKTCY